MTRRFLFSAMLVLMTILAPLMVSWAGNSILVAPATGCSGGTATVVVSTAFTLKGIIDATASDDVVMVHNDTSMTVTVLSMDGDPESLFVELWRDANSKFGDVDMSKEANIGDATSTWVQVHKFTNPTTGNTVTLALDQGWHLVRYYLIDVAIDYSLDPSGPLTNMMVFTEDPGTGLFDGVDMHSLTGITAYMGGNGNSTLGVVDSNIIDFRINRLPGVPTDK